MTWGSASVSIFPSAARLSWVTTCGEDGRRMPEHHDHDEPPDASYRLPEHFLLIVEDRNGNEVLVRTPQELRAVEDARNAPAPEKSIERDDTVTVDGLPGLWAVDGFSEFSWSGRRGEPAKPPTVYVSQTVIRGLSITVTGEEVYPSRVHLARKGNLTEDLMDTADAAGAALSPQERAQLAGALDALAEIATRAVPTPYPPGFRAPARPPRRQRPAPPVAPRPSRPPKF